LKLSYSDPDKIVGSVQIPKLNVTDLIVAFQAYYKGGNEMYYVNIQSNHWNYTTYTNLTSNVPTSLINGLGYILSIG
jgi:hypothetical protein